MIASPGDVSEERKAIREVIHDWNDVNAARSKVVLEPVGWESHSSPELGMRAQELINTRILKDCDILIAVFWTRLGTATGESESGSVEEIREHVTAGKPAMVYFSSKPVAPESIDLDQYNAVKTFREECEASGLVEAFANVDEFKQKLSRQIALTLTKSPYISELLAGSERNIGSKRPEVVEAVSVRRELSSNAEQLLKASAQDSGGTILRLSYVGGSAIQAGSRTFGGDSGREFAKWENALEELIADNLVVARGYKGEVFELTHRGWSVADEL